MQPVIKWSGSKRSQARYILSLFPADYGTYYEPFIGGGAMLYAAMPNKAVCGDICAPLVELWNAIKKEPAAVIASYAKHWQMLQEQGYTYYYEVREHFNKAQNGLDLLFLSRTCVNGLIRFNAQGEFNNSLHHSRPGIAPERLARIIEDWSFAIRNADFHCADYRQTTATAKCGDFVYLDPPYFHTKGRYYGAIDMAEFLQFLEDLNSRGIRFALSFDGRRGEDDFSYDLPPELYKRHLYIPSGNSSFKKVMDNQCVEVLESLYLNY